MDGDDVFGENCKESSAELYPLQMTFVRDAALNSAQLSSSWQLCSVLQALEFFLEHQSCLPLLLGFSRTRCVFAVFIKAKEPGMCNQEPHRSLCPHLSPAEPCQVCAPPWHSQLRGSPVPALTLGHHTLVPAALPSPPGTPLQFPCSPQHRMAHQSVSRGDAAGNHLNPQRLNRYLNSLG